MKSSDERFNEIEAKIDALTNQITIGFDLANKRFEALENNISKLDTIEKKIDNLKAGSNHTMSTIETELREGFAKVISELKKINLQYDNNKNKNEPD